MMHLEKNLAVLNQTKKETKTGLDAFKENKYIAGKRNNQITKLKNKQLEKKHKT